MRTVARLLALPVIILLLSANSCEQRATEAKARIASQKVVAEICSVWLPITDTTSSQVRAHNRARYAFCETEKR